MFYQRGPPLFRRGGAHEEEEDDAAKYLGGRTTIRFAQWPGLFEFRCQKSLTVADELHGFSLSHTSVPHQGAIRRRGSRYHEAPPGYFARNSRDRMGERPWQKSKSYAPLGMVSSILISDGSPWRVPGHMKWQNERDHRGCRRLTRTFHEDYSSLSETGRDRWRISSTLILMIH